MSETSFGINTCCEKRRVLITFIWFLIYMTRKLPNNSCKHALPLSLWQDIKIPTLSLFSFKDMFMWNKYQPYTLLYSNVKNYFDDTKLMYFIKQPSNFSTTSTDMKYAQYIWLNCNICINYSSINKHSVLGIYMNVFIVELQAYVFGSVPDNHHYSNHLH